MPKIISRDELVATIKKHKGLWRVPEPYVWQYDRTMRKVYYLTCKCGKPAWIPWRKLQQGESMGCRSCRRKTHGKRYDPIYLSWHGLTKKRKPMVPAWQGDFKNFYRWAKPMYEKGWKLIRIDPTQPYGPDNCDYVPICRKKIKVLPVQSLEGYSTLPMGRQTAMACLAG